MGSVHSKLLIESLCYITIKSILTQWPSTLLGESCESDTHLTSLSMSCGETMRSWTKYVKGQTIFLKVFATAVLFARVPTKLCLCPLSFALTFILFSLASSLVFLPSRPGVSAVSPPRQGSPEWSWATTRCTPSPAAWPSPSAGRTTACRWSASWTTRRSKTSRPRSTWRFSVSAPAQIREKLSLRRFPFSLTFFSPTISSAPN